VRCTCPKQEKHPILPTKTSSSRGQRHLWTQHHLALMRSQRLRGSQLALVDRNAETLA
jgi:hypothetical protein